MSSWRENPGLVLEDDGVYQQFIEEMKTKTSDDDELEDLRQKLCRYLSPYNTSVPKFPVVTRGLGPSVGLYFVVHYRSPYPSQDYRWTLDLEFVRRLEKNALSDEEYDFIQSIKTFMANQELSR